MTTGEEIRQAIRNIISQYLVTTKLREPKVCTVKAVYANPSDAMVCDCAPIDNTAIIKNVHLLADNFNGKAGFILAPKLNSKVQISFRDDSSAFVSMVSEVDFIYLNGNDYGGIVNAIELKTQLDKNNQLLEHIIAVINGAAIPEPGSSSPSALQAALKTAILSDSVADLSNIQNTTVLHGTGNLN